MSRESNQMLHAEGDLLEEAADWHLRLTAQPGDAVARAEFERWLARDLGHRLAYADVRAADFALEQQDDFVAAAAWPARRASRPASRSRAWLVGVGLSMLVLVAAWQGARPWDAMRSDLRTAEGETAEFELPDGSRLWLGGDSAVAYDFTAARRDVSLLRGEATFDVAHDKSRPFVVQAGHTSATAVGTQYAVSHRGRGAVVVEVAEGRVSVAREGVEDPVFVDAGLQIRSDAAGLPAQPEALGGGALEWRRGLLVLDNATLAEAAVRLDAYIPGRVVLLGKGDARVSAAIALDDAPAALAAIAAREGLQVDSLPGLVMVLH